MEELDYEDILLIHPDEDVKKIETDANSNLEESIETDVNLNLDEAIEVDANLNLEDTIQTDINSNLEEDVETDSNSSVGEVIGADVESNLVHAEKINADSTLDGAIENAPKSYSEQAFDSDSGEIDDDEEANDLEEGEIKDNSTILQKRSDIACRFFKRGSCAFGSQCQYLHVSDTVYKMFDTNPQRRNDLQPLEHPNFLKPLIFPPNALPPRQFIEPVISVSPKADFHKKLNTLEDNWEKGLEQARILIQKANSKRKNEEDEPKKLNSINSSENTKGQSFTKTHFGNELPHTKSRKLTEKSFTHNGLRNARGDKKLNYRSQPRSSDNWVDPWRRSKSPVSKSRRRSHSSSPFRSRKRSYASSTSSTSSSTSEIDNIYERPYKKKSPLVQRVSKSRSISQTRQPKKRRMSPKYSHNGRRNFRSFSRSFSRSPDRKRNFRSRSRSSSSSCSDCQIGLEAEDKDMNRISAKLNEQFHDKSLKRASPSLHSDCETSEMTVSSASCTSLSSDSETESPCNSPFIKGRQSPNQKNSSYSNKYGRSENPKVFNRSESNLLRNQDAIKHKDDIVPAFYKKAQPYNGGKNQNNWSSKTESTEHKPKNAASNFNSVKKPADFSKNKRSDDMNLLFMYQDLASTKTRNNMPGPTKIKTSNPSALKQSKVDDAVKGVNKANSKSETQNKASKVRKVSTHDMNMLFLYQDLRNTNKDNSNVQNVKTNNSVLKQNKTDAGANVGNKDNNYVESYQKKSKECVVPKQNIVLNLQPKSKDNFKPDSLNKPQDNVETATAKKTAASKRELLLNKLKLIDDAIARKKCK